MKAKNKKFMTALVAVFMLVFVSGSAFALMSSGPLVWNGTATVDVTLELMIVDSAVTHNAVSAKITPDNSNIGSGVKYIVFEVDFDQHGQAAKFDFTYENVGTVPAQITNVVLTPGGSATPLSGLNGSINVEIDDLQPGDKNNVVFDVKFDINPTFTGNSVSGTRTWILEVHYSPLGHGAPLPGSMWTQTFSE